MSNVVVVVGTFQGVNVSSTALHPLVHGICPTMSVVEAFVHQLVSAAATNRPLRAGWPWTALNGTG